MLFQESPSDSMGLEPNIRISEIWGLNVNATPRQFLSNPWNATGAFSAEVWMTSRKRCRLTCPSSPHFHTSRIIKTCPRNLFPNPKPKDIHQACIRLYVSIQVALIVELQNCHCWSRNWWFSSG